jgi:hypothetical protein
MVTSMMGNYLKIIKDKYRVNLRKGLKFEHPSMVPKREWKDRMEDAEEKRLKREGNTPLGCPRYNMKYLFEYAKKKLVLHKNCIISP